MTRTAPPLPLNLPTLAAPEGFAVALRTVTPMFGGGAETRVVDERYPVRAASVRGHLRFWWRATAGAGYQTAKDLYDAESALWGNTERHGRVRVEVVEQKASPPRVPQLPRELGYATFPFQEQRARRDNPGMAAAMATSVEFIVRLTCPTELRPQLETALHAWVLFGGIGSRTRRGCGSLELIGTQAQVSRPDGQGHKMLTTLPGRYFAGKPQRDPLQAWAEAVAVYRDFRQGVGFARNKGQQPNRPGRSRYPEPDTLRELTRRYGHKVIHPVRGFPRADLGLPIIFHFQDAQKKGEPGDQTLQGSRAGRQRFASPVITKAARIGGEYLPLVLVLDSPHVWDGPGVELRGQGAVRHEQMDLPREALEQISPLGGLPVREALTRYVKAESQGFQEVPL